MADGRFEAADAGPRRGYLFPEIFRCFQVALDPRKLALAAAGVVAMSAGWYLLSVLFYYPKPDPNAADYQAATIQRELADPDAPPAELARRGEQKYAADLRQWAVLDDLAGRTQTTDARHTAPGGRLRTWPWDEYRGPNPYLLFTALVSGSGAQRADAGQRFLTGTLPVMAEPLFKLFLPLIYFLDANASLLTRVYLLLCMLWSLAVWAFFGGAITRLAAVQLAGTDRVSLTEAVRFVAARYPAYVLSPVVPLAVMFVVAVGLAVYAVAGMVPYFNVLAYGLGLPLAVLGGLLMAILLIGLVGYPLMYCTVSTEGSDTFDALSRAYNYVFQAPATYAWYSLVAVAYGAVVTLAVVFVASVGVYLTRWSLDQAPLTEYANRKPAYLYLYAPTSFGWQQLLLQGTPLELTDARVANAAGRERDAYAYADPARAERYQADSLYPADFAVGRLAGVWLSVVFLMVLGFSYSYFWSAAAMIYLLMRKKVDETELDEVYLEDDLPDAPVGPAATPVTDPGPAATPLPTVPPPAPAGGTVPFAAPPAPAAVTLPPANTTGTEATDAAKAPGLPKAADLPSLPLADNGSAAAGGKPADEPKKADDPVA